MLLKKTYCSDIQWHTTLDIIFSGVIRPGYQFNHIVNNINRQITSFQLIWPCSMRRQCNPIKFYSWQTKVKFLGLVYKLMQEISIVASNWLIILAFSCEVLQLIYFHPWNAEFSTGSMGVHTLAVRSLKASHAKYSNISKAQIFPVLQQKVATLKSSILQSLDSV